MVVNRPQRSLFFITLATAVTISRSLDTLFTSTSASSHDSVLARDASEDSASARRFLLTLDPTSTPSVQHFSSYLKELGISHRISLDLTSLVPDVFYGASIQLEREEDAQLLDRSDRVIRAHRVRKVQPVLPTQSKLLDLPATPISGPFPPHVQTRVNELHALGIFGKGIKVAILDSGVECEHPALGGGFGKGFKIGFGRNLVKESCSDKKQATKPNNRTKNNTPCSGCGPHGTHVAGIIGANDAGGGFTGVAPNATIGMYRVFCCGKGAEAGDDTLLAGFLHAYKDGADIISASLGGSGGWGQGDPVTDVVNKLATKKNALIFIAAGNEGTNGMFFGDNPASGIGSISVGSVDASALVAANFTSSTGRNMTYYGTTRFAEGQSFPVYVTGSANNTADACQPLPQNTPDLGNYLVAIRRGTCLFADKVKNAKARGGKRILFYMNSTSIIGLPPTVEEIPVAVTTDEDGKYISQHVRESPHKFRLSFPYSWHSWSYQPDAGFMSEFSQYGPSFDMVNPQPAVSGVGGNILSTYPKKNGSYASLSGTSMSTPQLAGIAALVLSVRGKNFTSASMRARLSTSTRVLDVALNDNRLESVIHQGGGLVDAFCAVFANTSLSTSSLTLNDSSWLRTEQKFTITNEGNQPITYHLKHLAAATVSTFSPGSKYHRPDEKVIHSNQSASVVIMPRQFTLSPGAKQRVRVLFTPPSGLKPEALPVYSGFIVLDTATRCERHTVPYFGLLGSLKAQPILDRGYNENKTEIYPFLAFKKAKKSKLKPKNEVISLGRGGSFQWNPAKRSLTLHFRTVFGTPWFRVDVIHSNDKPCAQCPNSHLKDTFKGMPLIGVVPDSNNTYMARSAHGDEYLQNWNGTIVTTVEPKPHPLPSGSYKLLMRALRVTGDRTHEEDFDYWISPTIKIERQK